MLLLETYTLLIALFIIHILWWRIKKPLRTTRALLFIFFLIPFVLFIIDKNLIYKCLNPEFLQGILLYMSNALVYIILYSAIEQQSPTLKIINLIKKSKIGCTNQEIIHYINPTNEISERLNSMLKSQWLRISQNNLELTEKGIKFAVLFKHAAQVFNLKTGG